jgi:lactoylglutathione lyase
MARDWRRLVAFYCDVFGCVPKPPERDIAGEWIDRVAGLRKARLRGMHLRLPGFGDSGPTLEIFTYDQMDERPSPAANQPGYGHIAFAVDDVDAMLRTVIAAGGSALGDVVTTLVEGVGTLRVVYVRDPEGNIIELQKWS